MADPTNEIIVPTSIHHAVWPGGEWVCMEVVAKKVAAGMWLLGQDGRQQELREYSYRAWHRRRH